VYFGLVQTYVDWSTIQGLPHAWSLCLEVAFYVFLAVWVQAFRGRRFHLARELLVLGALSAASLGVQYAYYDTAGRWNNLDLTLPANLFMFCAGMALAAISVAGDGRRRRGALWRLVARRPSLCWVGAAAVYWYLCYPLGLPPRGAPIQSYTAAGWLLEQVLGAVVGILVILPAIFGENEPGPPRRVLAAPALRYLGTVSYGVYLWHVPVLGWIAVTFAQFRTYDNVAIDLALAVVVSTAIASVSYIVVEKPFLQLHRLRARAPATGEGDDDRWHHQGRNTSADDGREAPPRLLGVPWKEGLLGGMVGYNNGAAAGGAAGWALSSDARSTRSSRAVHPHETRGLSGRHQEVAVGDPRGGEVGGRDPQEATRVAEVDATPTGGEARRNDGQPGDFAADGARPSADADVAHRAVGRDGDEPIRSQDYRVAAEAALCAGGDHGQPRTGGGDPIGHARAASAAVELLDGRAVGPLDFDEQRLPEAPRLVERGRTDKAVGHSAPGGARSLRVDDEQGALAGGGREENEVVRAERAQRITGGERGKGCDAHRAAVHREAGGHVRGERVGPALPIDEPETAAGVGDPQSVGPHPDEVGDPRQRVDAHSCDGGGRGVRVNGRSVAGSEHPPEHGGGEDGQPAGRAHGAEGRR
jgi:hypothetical protein